MNNKKEIKPKVELKSIQLQKFMNWMLENVFLYGEPWLEWWKEKGQESFIQWSRLPETD